jgi:UDP-N-acetylmuramate dehydrogenase
MKILKEISLKPFNTFGINVKAKFFVEIKNEEEIREILTKEEYSSIPKVILGGGSNILLTKDFDGLVIKISIPGIKIIEEDDDTVLIEAGAGVIWHDLVLFCIEKNYGGIENLSLIPGMVGAAPVQNIGAYGQELKEVFQDLHGFFINNGNPSSFKKEDCKFGYRDSIFKRELKDKFVITHVRLRLSKKPLLNLEYGALKSEIKKLGLNNISIKEVSEVVCKIRKSKLPDPSEIGNAGSFFKNPEIKEEQYNELLKDYPGMVGYKIGNGKIKVAAGWLIEKCGWKGKRVGETGIHKNQALVLVNYGNASGREVLNLAREIKNSVFEKFGIDLVEEVNIV